MPSPNLGFDHRNLPAASLDSCDDSQPLGFDLRERGAADAECSGLARKVLPALDYNIGVLRIEFQSVTGALGQFCCDQGSARAQEGIVDDSAALGVILNRAPHEFYRLL